MGDILIRKDYYYCDELKKGFYPLEEAMPVLKNYCLPDLKEQICYLSSSNPYNLTQEILEKIGGTKISTSHIQKVSNLVGKELIDIEEETINNPKKIKEIDKNKKKTVISVDGAIISTYNDWKEVKTGVVYELKDTKKGLESVNKSYVSKIEDHLSFRKRLKTEANRREYYNTNELIVIGDGARWIWDLAENEFPRSVKIVDWYHAKEHLHKIVELLYESDANKGREVEKLLEKNLYDGDIDNFIKIIDRCKIETKILDRFTDFVSLETEVGYFSRNESKMQYRYFEEQGYPIGSGVIESACKQVVQLRLKRSGMKWKNEGAHAILKLRTMYLSDRWDEVVSTIKKVA